MLHEGRAPHPSQGQRSVRRRARVDHRGDGAPHRAARGSALRLDAGVERDPPPPRPSLTGPCVAPHAFEHAETDQPREPPNTYRPRASRRRRAILVIGVSGSAGSGVTDLLSATLPTILARDPEGRALLVGKGSVESAASLFGDPPTARVAATGAIAHDEIVAHLAACDVMLQPYAGGQRRRRTAGTMASLARRPPSPIKSGGQRHRAGVERTWRRGARDARVRMALVLAAEPILFLDRALRDEIAARGRALPREVLPRVSGPHVEGGDCR